MISLAKLGYRILRSNGSRPPRPFKLTLIVTWTCDTRCKMCSIWKRDKQGVMTLDEVRAFFDRNPWFSWVNLSGGEIWTRDDAAELCLAVVERSPDLHLMDFPTTGQKTEAIVAGVDRLLATRLPKLLVTVSLDGDRATHEDIRGVKGAFDRACATFAELRRRRSSRFDCFLGMTLSNWNRGRIMETFEAARAAIPGLELREMHVNLAQESSHYYQNQGMGRTEEEALSQIESFVGGRGGGLHPVAWLERKYQTRLREFLRTGKSPLPCMALSSSVFVDARWNVYPCTMWDAPVANLRDHAFDLGAVWESDRAKSLAADARALRCPNCWTPCEAYQTILGNLARA